MEGIFQYGIDKLTINKALQLARGQIKGVITDEAKTNMLRSYEAVQSMSDLLVSDGIALIATIHPYYKLPKGQIPSDQRRVVTKLKGGAIVDNIYPLYSYFTHFQDCRLGTFRVDQPTTEQYPGHEYMLLHVQKV